MAHYADNKKAFFNYEILEEYEAGIVLSGAEVKSIREGKISLKEAFATIRGGEVWLTNAHISPYKPAHQEGYEPTQSRKLLLSKAEIAKIIGQVESTNLTLIPLSVYGKNRRIKVKIGLAKGKKKYDKKEVLKKRDIERETQRELKER